MRLSGICPNKKTLRNVERGVSIKKSSVRTYVWAELFNNSKKTEYLCKQIVFCVNYGRIGSIFLNFLKNAEAFFENGKFSVAGNDFPGNNVFPLTLETVGKAAIEFREEADEFFVRKHRTVFGCKEIYFRVL